MGNYSVVKTNVSQLHGISMNESQRYVEQNRNLQKNIGSWISLCKDPQQDKLIAKFLRNACICGKTIKKSKEVIKGSS